MRKFGLLAGIVGAVAGLFGCGEGASTRAVVPETGSLDQMVVKGFALSPKQAEQLEGEVKEHPEDVRARIMVMGCYFSHGMTNARVPHVLWMIEHHPELHFTGTPMCRLEKGEQGYGEARGMWERMVAERPEPAVLGNAAKFFERAEPAEAEKLLEQAAELEPQSPTWHAMLGQMEMLQLVGKKGTPASRVATARQALKEYEAAAALTPDRLERSYLLWDLAKAALICGDEGAAKRSAEEMLAAAAAFPNDWNAGNGIYNGNVVLGRIALAHGDVAGAKRYLLAAARTQGSPQLMSFGPNMMLARELVEKGERKTVVEYLELCGKFWKMGAERLAEWKKVVEAGGMPEWGGNLYY